MTVCFQEVRCGVFKGLKADLQRRLPHYKSDYLDGITDKKGIQKIASTTFFLYFACVLPSIAFGVLNASNTNGILSELNFHFFCLIFPVGVSGRFQYNSCLNALRACFKITDYFS